MTPPPAEEFDPETGTFRPIAEKKPARKAGAKAGQKPAQRPGGAEVVRRPYRGSREAPSRPTGLSEEGDRYGVFYEVFSDALKTDQAKYLVWASKAVIVVVFLLLLYEAISYRIALG